MYVKYTLEPGYYPHELQPKFEDYISNLQKIIPRVCANCSTEFCFACGERISSEKPTHQKGSTSNDVLFHCSNIQGIILGVGLSMLEQLFTEQTQEGSQSSTPLSKTSKKRKARESVADDMDEDDDIHYGSGNARGKKSKGGTGYAGASKEDVRQEIF